MHTLLSDFGFLTRSLTLQNLHAITMSLKYYPPCQQQPVVYCRGPELYGDISGSLTCLRMTGTLPPASCSSPSPQ